MSSSLPRIYSLDVSLRIRELDTRSLQQPSSAVAMSGIKLSRIAKGLIKNPNPFKAPAGSGVSEAPQLLSFHKSAIPDPLISLRSPAVESKNWSQISRVPSPTGVPNSYHTATNGRLNLCNVSASLTPMDSSRISDVPSAINPKAKMREKRPQTCTRCRSLKSKCDKRKPSSSRCSGKGIECIYSAAAQEVSFRKGNLNLEYQPLHSRHASGSDPQPITRSEGASFSSEFGTPHSGNAHKAAGRDEAKLQESQVEVPGAAPQRPCPSLVEKSRSPLTPSRSETSRPGPSNAPNSFI